MNKEQIINENVGLIYMIAKKFYNVSKEDLFQAGVLGLLKAYQNYDESYGAKFTSFAYTYIYGEMYTLANNRQIKINKDILKVYKLIEETKNNLALKNGVVPSYETVANFLEIDPNKIYEYVYAGQSIMSLDNDENRPLYETISNKEDVSLDERIELENSMCTLTEDEKKRFTYNGDLIVSSLARKISDLKTNEDMRNLKCTSITNWLLSLGYLKIVEQDGKNRKLPTQMGKNLGMYTQVRDGYKGRYEVVLYNKNAQIFIMDNIDKIIIFANKDEEML